MLTPFLHRIHARVLSFPERWARHLHLPPEVDPEPPDLNVAIQDIAPGL
jgi:hypothetical protein